MTHLIPVDATDVDDDAPPTPTAVIPAKAGIQYAASSQFSHERLGILDRPPSRTMTVEIVCGRNSAFSRHHLPEFYKSFRPKKEQPCLK
jgi:hypothetical protein